MNRLFGLKRAAVMLAVATMTALGVGATATSASAAINWPSQWSHTWTTDNGGWVNVRHCSTPPGCGVKFALYGYSPVKMLCWTNGTYAYGTSKWFYVYSNSANNYGYVNANLVVDQVWSPAC